MNELDALIGEFIRNGEGNGASGASDLAVSVEYIRTYVKDKDVPWSKDFHREQRFALAHEFTFIRAHICGIPMGPYGTVGHRDLAKKAELLTTMERELLQRTPSFKPFEYVDMIFAYWETLADKYATYRFLAILLQALHLDSCRT